MNCNWCDDDRIITQWKGRQLECGQLKKIKTEVPAKSVNNSPRKRIRTNYLDYQSTPKLQQQVSMGITIKYQELFLLLRLHVVSKRKQNKIPAMNILTYFISADYFDVLIKRMSRKNFKS